MGARVPARPAGRLFARPPPDLAFPEQESYSSSGHHKVCRFVIETRTRCGSCDSQEYRNGSVTDKQSASRIPRTEWLRTNRVPQQRFVLR